MPRSNPYQALVSRYAKLLQTRPLVEPQRLTPQVQLRPAQAAAKVLVFSPHPDDECIIGGLPLRLLREQKLQIINVAVTLGSNKNRQVERWHELCEACDYLGFSVLASAERGLEHINLTSRAEQPQRWATAVAVIADILSRQQPRIIFIPHAGDWNQTHIGTHYLVHDALKRMPPGFHCLVAETEFWQAMATPNLLVESSSEDVADLVAALSLHRGEVARNPYHLRLPAWLIDNVRRGAELVNGQGEAAPHFAFATLYRLHGWANGQLQCRQNAGHIIAQGDSLDALLDY